MLPVVPRRRTPARGWQSSLYPSPRCHWIQARSETRIRKTAGLCQAETATHPQLRHPENLQCQIVRAHDRPQVWPLITMQAVHLLGTTVFAHCDVLPSKRRLAIAVVPVAGTQVLTIDVDAGVRIRYAYGRCARACREHCCRNNKHE